MFIRRTDFKTDVKKIIQDLDVILSLTDWGRTNQIGLTHRPQAHDPWQDSVGSLFFGYTQANRPQEQDFNCLNSQTPDYLVQQINGLKLHESCELGRIRFMKLPPKTGLSVHYDTETRYHLVIQTNPTAYIGVHHAVRNNDSTLPTTSITYHMPCDGHWYEVDTTRQHYVYNGGTEDRIHLVACKLNK